MYFAYEAFALFRHFGDLVPAYTLVVDEAPSPELKAVLAITDRSTE